MWCLVSHALSYLFVRGSPFWILTSQTGDYHRAGSDPPYISREAHIPDLKLTSTPHATFSYRDPIFASATSCRVCSDRYVIEHEKASGRLLREFIGIFDPKHRNHNVHSPDCPQTKCRCRGHYASIFVRDFLDIHRRDKVRNAQPQTRLCERPSRADPSSEPPHCFHVLMCLLTRWM
jgi:hypothetical protein